MGMEDPPAMPTNLSPCQSAELCELLDFMHRRIQRLVDDVEIREDDGEVILSLATWQRLLDIQARLSNLLRGISDPD